MRVSIAAALLVGFVAAQETPTWYSMWDAEANGALPEATAWAEQITYIEDNFSGFTIERHDGIVTDDDYVIELWRLIKDGSASTGNAVLLGHGANTNGLAWFNNGDQSIAYTLADEGYDVWVLNDRISGVSMTPHVTLTTADASFWDMSFVEVGLYDLPAALEYVSDTNTNDQMRVTYVGHSTGTTSMLTAMSAARKDFTDDYVESFVCLSPLIKFGDIGDEFEHGAQWAYHMQAYIESEGWTHLNMDNEIVDADGAEVEIDAPFPWTSWTTLADADESSSLEQIEEWVDEWPSKFQHPGYQKYDNHHADFKNELNSWTPLKQLLHFAQISREGTPINYNYLDEATNEAAYDGSADPPVFDMTAIDTTPIYVVMGHKDKINREDDQEWLEDNLTAEFYELNGSHGTPLQHQDMSWFSDNVLPFIEDNLTPYVAPTGSM